MAAFIHGAIQAGATHPMYPNIRFSNPPSVGKSPINDEPIIAKRARKLLIGFRFLVREFSVMRELVSALHAPTSLL